MVDDALTPRQRDILAGLIDRGGERPVFEEDLEERLRARLDEGLAPLVAQRAADAGTWHLAKRVLTEAHQCEGLHMARRAVPFEWSPEMARGTLAHRVIERLVLQSTSLAPLEQARSTIEKTALEDNDLGLFLRGLDEDVHADLVRDVSNAATEFSSQWPPVSARWAPRVETPVRAELCDGAVVLRGVYDLALGVPAGRQARTLIVDFKAGEIHHDHLLELRFYALIEALRVGVPPYRVAAYSLTGASYRVERVCEPMLDDTVDWVLAGATRLAALDAGAEATLSPSPLCKFCPASPECVPGRDFLDEHRPSVRTAER